MPISDRPGDIRVVRRIYDNLARLLGGKAAAAVVGLAYMAVAARALGPRDYGVLILVHGFAMTVGSLIGFPGWHAVVRFGAQAVAAGDAPRLVRLLRFTGLVEGVGAIVAIATAAILAPLIGPRLGWSPVAISFALPYSFAVLTSMRATPAGYLQLAGRFDLLGVHNLVPPLVRLAGALVALALGAGLRGFLIAWLVAAIAEWAAMWLFGIFVARQRLGGHRLFGSPRGTIADNPGIWRFMLAANADITFGELATRISPLVVGWVLGPAAAGLYSIAQRATVVIAQPAAILGRASYAELARLVARGGTGAEMRHALGRSVGIALAAALPVLALIALFGREVAVALGGGAFAGAAPVMIWLAAGQLILVLGPPASAALVALGRPSLSVAANMISGLGLLPLLPLLMHRFGLLGAGLQALLQAATAAGLLGWFFWRESDDRSRRIGRALA